MAEQRCKEMVDEQGRTLGPEHIGSFRFSNCGAEIVEGPCEQFRRVYRLCEDGIARSVNRDCGLMLAEHDSSQHHDYDGYVCTNGHPQEAPQ